MTSLHWTNDRNARAELIAQIGKGKIVKSAIIDRGHVNGPEIHCISNTGIISIFNQRTGKLITQLIARPAQISRYYGNEQPPKALLQVATEHTRLGYNMV